MHFCSQPSVTLINGRRRIGPRRRLPTHRLRSGRAAAERVIKEKPRYFMLFKHNLSFNISICYSKKPKL